MKKGIMRILGAVCAAAMLSGGAAMLPASAAEVQSAKVMGDLNGDLRVTMEDAKKALDIAVMGQVGLADNTATAENDAADINMNGEIETMDALSIMRYFCQTMVGEQPLWSELRKVTYHDGTEYDPYYVTPENKPEGYVHLPFEKRGMYVEIGCAEGKPGEVVDIPVYIAGINALTSIAYFQNTPEGVKLVNMKTDLEPKIGCVGIDEAYREYVDIDLDEVEEDVLMGVGNLANGAAVWCAYGGEPIHLTDGRVILTYQYKIPEDAQKGDTFVITVNPEKTTFAGEASKTTPCHWDTYQYTMLDGVIAVK